MKIHTSVLIVLVTFVYVSAIEFKLTKNGNTCVLFNTANSSQIKISKGTEEKTLNFAAAKVDQGGSDCTFQLWLEFPNKVVGKFLFRRNVDNSTSVNILVQFTPSEVFPGDSNTGIQIADDVSNSFKPPYLKSYQCTAEESIKFNNQPGNYTVEMMVSDVKLQAFDVQNGQFSNATLCEDEQTTVVTTQPTTTEKPTTEDNNGTTSSSNTTTEQPTTQPSNSSTEQTTASNETTVSPTTTPAVITTTAVPSPPPVVEFKLRNGNDTCIVFQARVSFKITYDTADSKTDVATFNLPNATKVDAGMSSCSHTNISQSLVLDFFDNWKLTMIFGLDPPTSLLAKAPEDRYSLHTVILTYVIDANRFPNPAEPGTTVTVTTKMPAKSLQTNGYYKCDKDITLTLNDTTLNHTISMETQKLQYQAFGTGNFTGFNSVPTECPNDTETNSIVPIAVGAALAGLVIIVLIAYLIGRKRSRGGYEQV